MTTHELKEYLQIALDLEKHIHIQQTAITQLKSRSEALGKAKSFQKPVPPEKPQHIAGIVAAVLLCGVSVLGIYLFVLGIQLLEDGSFSDGFLALLFLLPFSIFISILGIAGFCKKFSRLSDESSTYDIAKTKYDDAEKKYQLAVSSDALRVKEELAERSSLGASLNKLLAIHKTSVAALQEIYARDIIFPKYRTLAMVASITEYICSGRAQSLTGPNGAYNILETELRMDRIVTQIDTVISQLDRIQSNQYTLFNAVSSAKRTSEQLLGCAFQIADQVKEAQLQSQKQTDALIEKLHKTSALSAYQQERIRSELSYKNRMDYHTGRNDGVYDNLPPV